MRATDFVRSYFDAWNHRNPVAVADHLTSDGMYCDIPERAFRSHDELVVNLEEFFSTDYHRYDLIGEILEGPETIAFQYRMYPEGHGRNGDPAEIIRGAEFITLHGDAAITIYDYYDIPGAAKPSGVGPTRLSAGHEQAVKYAKSGLNDELMAEYKQRLEFVMQIERAYLRSDLTLPKLARLIDCSVNHLSQVINAGFGMSFFDYVNRYRVEYATQLLSGTDGKGGAVLNIAFTVGFNSNSAFYAAFKKFVRQTPAQFRRAQR